MKRLRTLLLALLGLGVLVLLGRLRAEREGAPSASPGGSASARRRAPPKPPKAPRAPRSRASARAPSAPAPSGMAASPWQGPGACRTALALAPSPRAKGVARIGAWNLHWFPDGGPGERPDADGSDLDWLACAVAWLRIDVLAVEEIKAGPRPRKALEDLASRLSALTGGRYRVLLDDCPKASSQHVGLLYDERRATLERQTILAELNPHGAPCKDQLRPGLAGYFRFPGGLDLTVVAAHLKSGGERRSFELRGRSFEAFGAAATAMKALTGDADVLLLGDMNSMGCPDCSPAVTPAEELAGIDRTLAASTPALRRFPVNPGCSHSYSGKKTLLDWAAGTDLAEVPAGRALTVSGYCAELGCATSSSPPRALLRLSDHCPVLVDIDDLDRDP